MKAPHESSLVARSSAEQQSADMQAVERQQESQGASTSAPPKSLARLILSRGLDILAIGVVLLLALTTGRGLMEWFGADTAIAMPESPSNHWSDQPVHLEMGDHAIPLTRESISGTRTDIEQSLVQRGGRAGANAVHPDWAIADRERQLLELLKGRTPISETERGAVYLLGGALPFAVAVSIKDAEQRLVWSAIAAPMALDRWTVFEFPAGSGNSNHSNGATNDSLNSYVKSRLKDPPASRRVISLTTEAGESLRVWTLREPGAATFDDWRNHFSSAFAPVSPEGRLNWSQSGFQLDLQISDGHNGDLTVVLWMRTKGQASRP